MKLNAARKAREKPDRQSLQRFLGVNEAPRRT